MDVRKLSFEVFPAEAVLIDVAVRELDLPPEEVARMIFRAGLEALRGKNIPIDRLPMLRMEYAGAALAFQRGLQIPGNEYALTGGRDLDSIVVLPTDKERAATYAAGKVES